MNSVLRWCEEMLSLPENVWIEYVRRREPLRGRVDFDAYKGFWCKACEEGKEQAGLLFKEHGTANVAELAEKLCVSVQKKPLPDATSGRATYASFTEPDLIEIYQDNADALNSLIDAAEAKTLLGNIDVADVLLAHELYHVVQYRNTELFSMQKHIRLWKIFGIENNSRLVSLEEVSAMAFAGALTNISYTPYVFDVLLMLPSYPEKAKNIYRSIFEIFDEQKIKKMD